MNFLLPSQLNEHAARELAKAYIVAGPDYMPWPTEIRVDAGRLQASRSANESGCLVVPWPIQDNGSLLISTATLLERLLPYHLPVELARGKVNQLRNQAADWESGGLRLPGELREVIRHASRHFAQVATAQDDLEKADEHAEQTLAQAVHAADQLVEIYISQVFQLRHERQERLETMLGCRLESVPASADLTERLKSTLNTIAISFSWPDIELAQGDFHWERYDALFQWAHDHGFRIVAGPVVEFARNRLPDWLWMWDKDLSSVAGFMSEYVEAAIRRYHSFTNSWQITSASNWASVLSLDEQELLWLTARLLQAAHQTGFGIQPIVGIAQPWGEYLARDGRAHSPFAFADALYRTGIPITAFDIELIMGVWPRGSYRRDPLDVSRILDLYALLGLPVHVTLGCPSAMIADPMADPDFVSDASGMPEPWSPDVQSTWASRFGYLAAAKPYVAGVTWTHLSDSEPHLFPHCGLIAADGTVKPALEPLRRLREEHLK